MTTLTQMVIVQGITVIILFISGYIYYNFFEKN